METSRLSLRRFSPDDHADLHEYLSDERVVKYEPYGAYTTEQSRTEAIRRSADKRFWAVCLKESGKMIGNIYMADEGFDCREIGYVFNAKYWGQGFATEAARAVITDAFENHTARRIIAQCNPLNISSWRLLERLGFRREGHLIGNIWFKKDNSGRPIWADTYLYAVLKQEWRG